MVCSEDRMIKSCSEHRMMCREERIRELEAWNHGERLWNIAERKYGGIRYITWISIVNNMMGKKGTQRN